MPNGRVWMRRHVAAICPYTRWLTELSCRKKTDEEQEQEPKPQGDEDGPMTSGEEDVRDVTDDESISSGEQEILPPLTETYTGFFEHQREARCAIHALNNALGCSIFWDHISVCMCVRCALRVAYVTVSIPSEVRTVPMTT